MTEEEYVRIMQAIRANSVYVASVGQNIVTVSDVRVILERETK